METKNRINYEAPVAAVINLQHTRMLMTSDPVSATMNGTFYEETI
jgi:hypothetical protein